MDVVNGKIVSARTERSIAEAWSALQPSRGRTVESSMMHGSFDYLRAGNGGDWGVAPPSSFISNVERPFSAWGGCGVAPGHDPPNSFALDQPGAARWNSRPSHHVGAYREFSGMQPRPIVEHRQGWGGGDKRHFHFNPKPLLQPDSETDLDQMLEMYESQITRLVPSRLTCASATSSLGQADQSSSLPSSLENSRESSLQRSGSMQEQSIPRSTLVSSVKRKRNLETSFSDEAGVQLDCSWSHPLKLLIRKGLSLSDVGELGRIIIPKKSAESQFQPVDTKEGSPLEMYDYDGSKRWHFRLKFWTNNKSRMYVLDNTGEFIKYHGLEEHDLFILYTDSSQKMVVRGHKGTDPEEDSTLDDVFRVTAPEEALQKISHPLPKRKRLTTTIALV
ncbi:hypothetical protein KC19_9G111900 [Ceratodon purpureus]|uniref:TF-B3 domain-containing protein n=1 Tax=Ceratodon purpureus TaxID=3225 RepID=A0A8T0GYP4_CERPU|nr:hypothetical protein KC19_9G111900 [Ceratodon purpureus]